MSDNGGGYFSRSSALLKRDKGWIKPLLVLGISQFVPIVGQLGLEGYALEWARLTAWGCDSAPKQKNVQVGQCIKSGWRGFVSVVGWGAIYGVLAWLLTWISQGSDFASGVVSTLFAIAGIFVGVLAAVCQVRAAIYQSFKAGYQANRIMDMLRRDFKGICRIALMTLVMSLVLGAAAALLALVIFVPSIIGVIGSTYGDYYVSDRMVVSQLMQSIAGMVPLLVLYSYAFSVATAYVRLITDTAVALWMRQFNVPQWGASADPLPPEQPAFSAPSAAAQPQYGQAQWQQPVQAPSPDQPVTQDLWQQPVPAQGATQPTPAQAPQAVQPFVPQEATSAGAPVQQAPYEMPAGEPVQQAPYEMPAGEPVQQAPYEMPAQVGATVPAAPQQAWQQDVPQADDGWRPVVPAAQDVVPKEAPAPVAVPDADGQPAAAAPSEAPEQPVVMEPVPVEAPAASTSQPASETQPPQADHRGVSPLGDLKPVEVRPVEPLAPVYLDPATREKDGGQE